MQNFHSEMFYCNLYLTVISAYNFLLWKHTRLLYCKNTSKINTSSFLPHDNMTKKQNKYGEKAQGSYCKDVSIWMTKFMRNTPYSKIQMQSAISLCHWRCFNFFFKHLFFFSFFFLGGRCILWMGPVLYWFA